MEKAARGSHGNSILTGKDKRCYVTGRTEGLDKHHIYHGPGWRSISDRNGFWVYLWQPLHLAALGGLHKYPNSGLDLELKQACQRKFEETHTREEFMKIIGKNYLGDEEAEREDSAEAGGFFLLEGTEAEG